MNQKVVKKVHVAPKPHWVGDGFLVHSMFHYGQTYKNIDPFLLMDYAPAMYFEPNFGQPKGVGQHPHRGFETVTIAYQGQVSHKDATGGEGTIDAGDVQWMTAGAGVMHQEFHSDEFSTAGGLFEMVQLWVNLPAKDKMTPPAYHTLKNADIKTHALDGGLVRVIAGEFDGTKGIAPTFSPINLWDIRLDAGTRHEFAVPHTHNLLILVLEGNVQINGHTATHRELVTFERGGCDFVIESQDNSKLLILSGEPLHEPVVGHGPFVMNTQEEIAQAFDDVRAGKFGLIAQS